MSNMKDTAIIMPVFNEVKTLEKVLAKVLTLEPREIIIVDDGSTDGTRDLLKGINDTRCKIVFHSENKGKGAAIITAMQYVSAPIVTIQDADLEYNPDELKDLAAPIMQNKAEVVYGSRFLKPAMKNIYIRYRLGNWFLSKLISVLFRTEITDSYTCYKVFKTSVLKELDLKSRRFEIEAEFTVKILKKGIKILEIPIDYNPRRLEEGKKIGWLDGIKGIITIFKYSL
ncbi:MAG: Undecaprenyl-phosphate mannosyltransferase [Elusimicrobia bacterium ADurb.Bin231]|nr:MAG: Undecaprenyl-phosphate mannosyltransferase [Elusimicrobia bacterium ADurb.Bin231]